MLHGFQHWGSVDWAWATSTRTKGEEGLPLPPLPWGCLGPGAEAASDQGMHLLLCAPSSALEAAKLSKFTGSCEGGLGGGGEGA